MTNKKEKSKDENHKESEENATENHQIDTELEEDIQSTEDLDLDSEIEQLKEKLLRAQAEVQNVRRIASQEVTKARLYGVESLAREFLTVGDNLIRALESCNEDQPMGSVKEGLELTLKSFESSLGTAGIESINPDGELFDPHKHEAISILEDDSKENDSVLEVVQKGYSILDRTLRPAKVIVSKKTKKN